MKLELIQTGPNRYKIISTSTKKHPALKHLASLLSTANKFENVKIGIYNIPPNPFQPFKNVYSYITGRFEKMNRKSYYRFKKGERQLKPVNWWTQNKKEMEELFS